jgi:hypothetical protein
MFSSMEPKDARRRAPTTHRRLREAVVEGERPTRQREKHFALVLYSPLK